MVVGFILRIVEQFDSLIAPANAVDMSPASNDNPSNFWLSFLCLSAGIFAPVYLTVLKELWNFKYTLKIVRVRSTEDLNERHRD